MSFFVEKFRQLFTGGSADNKKVKVNEHLKRDQDPNELWEIIGELGDGAFGKVYKVWPNKKSRYCQSVSKSNKVLLKSYVYVTLFASKL